MKNLHLKYKDELLGVFSSLTVCRLRVRLCPWLIVGLCVSLDDDVIKWKHFPRNWPFVRRIHRSPVNSSHKGQWRGALMFSLICVWINDWVNKQSWGWWFETLARPLWRHCKESSETGRQQRSIMKSVFINKFIRQLVLIKRCSKSV